MRSNPSQLFDQLRDTQILLTLSDPQMKYWSYPKYNIDIDSLEDANLNVDFPDP
jgi:hypothetical protein